MKIYLLLPLVLTACAQYSLNFNSPAGRLTYEYGTAVDFTNVSMWFILHPDPEFTAASIDGIQQFITIESTVNDKGYMDFFYIDILPPAQGGAPTENTLMATFATPKSSIELDTLTYCLTIVPFDFSTDENVIHINKTGPDFSMTINGTADNIYCANNDIGAAGTGALTMNKITISSYKGCISELQFPEIDFLPVDECGFPADYIKGDVTYFEGHCGGDDPQSQEAMRCPTTPPPTTSATSTTPTDPPEPTTEVQVEASTASESQPTSTPPSPASRPVQTDISSAPTDDASENNTVEPDVTDYIIAPSNEAEKTIGDDGTSPDNKAVIIIIVVVAGGILVVVVLLYVGYRFHFRDKGSYKLDEAKTEPTEDYGNEYTDLNPTTKDQEWYL